MAAGLFMATDRPALAQRAELEPQVIRDAVLEELSAARYQRELEHAPPRETPERRGELPLEFLEIVGWLALGCIAIAGLYILVRFLADRRAPVLGEDGAGEQAAVAAGTLKADEILAEADRLARANRFGEAIHRLLTGLLDTFRERQTTDASPQLTSREVLARAHLSEALRSRLGLLVGAVERALFAGREAGPGDFDACRSSFVEIANDITGTMSARRAASPSRSAAP